MFKMKFIDGSPVPDDYLQKVTQLVHEAVEDDPGEDYEAEVIGSGQHKITTEGEANANQQPSS